MLCGKRILCDDVCCAHTFDATPPTTIGEKALCVLIFCCFAQTFCGRRKGAHAKCENGHYTCRQCVEVCGIVFCRCFSQLILCFTYVGSRVIFHADLLVHFVEQQSVESLSHESIGSSKKRNKQQRNVISRFIGDGVAFLC